MDYLLEISSALEENNCEFEFCNRPIFIYGAGNAGGIAFTNLQKLKLEGNVKAFLDKNADAIKNKKFGLDIIKADDNKISVETRRKSIVFISLISDLVEYEHIKKYLLDIGYGTVYFYFGLSFLDRIKESEHSNVKKAFELLEDNKSKEIYLKWIKFNKTICDNFFENNKENIQYFTGDIKFEKGYNRFIDCGAYIGDTAEEIMKNKGKIDAIACFEADIENYGKLSENMKKNRVAKEQILLPCAVWNKQEILRFNTMNSASSFISEDGNELITAISIDQCLADFAPTFIKMDIEGAEEEALIGATETIKRYKPDLAICVYHKIDHLWKLLIYINDIVKGYKFYMRCHHFSGMETVLYATYVGE